MKSLKSFNLTYYRIDSTPSTNNLLSQILKTEKLQTGFVVVSDFQTAGRGLAENSWEAERGKNLTFSILFRPENLTVDKNFILSQASSLAVKSVLDDYLPKNSIEKFKIKWSNDIYFGEKKICGILIENNFKGNQITYSIIGIGLNINQINFKSDAPNPISLSQIVGEEIENLDEILEKICRKIIFFLSNNNNYKNLKSQYFNALYRNDGFYFYKTKDNEVFSAKIAEIQDDGRLILETSEGQKRGFYFKEVVFV